MNRNLSLLPAFAALVILCGLFVSCGPSKHAIHLEMRHLSKSGVELAGKTVSVVYLETDDVSGTDFCEAMADGFVNSIENESGSGHSGIGIYKMRKMPGSNYAAKDSLFNILMDTGADLVILFDTVDVKTSPVSLRLYCFDAMNKSGKVQPFVGSLQLGPEEGWDAGAALANSFKPQWKHEQYSIIYYDSQKWYEALALAEQYDWKGAMDIWLSLLDTNDMLKRSGAAFNLSVACFMLGDYPLALEWLDRSDTDSKLPISDALRKRISERITM